MCRNCKGTYEVPKYGLRVKCLCGKRAERWCGTCLWEGGHSSRCLCEKLGYTLVAPELAAIRLLFHPDYTIETDDFVSHNDIIFAVYDMEVAA